MKRVAPGDVDERRLGDRLSSGPPVATLSEPVSIKRPTGAAGCWKCSRAGAHECGRLDCGNRAYLTADVPAGAVPDQGGCYTVPPRFSGE